MNKKASEEELLRAEWHMKTFLALKLVKVLNSDFHLNNDM
jgi:hypothetical protein